MAATPSDFDQPRWWDIVFGDFDAYRDWVHDRQRWDPLDPRTITDTRWIWSQRLRTEDDEAFAA